MTIAFLLTALVVAVTPGTGVTHTLATAVTAGRRAGLAAAAGATLSLVPHVIAAVTGLAALLRAGTPAFRVVTWLGVAYLLWMAWSAWRDRGAFTVDADRPPRPASAVFRDGVLLNLLNPKVTVFFVAFLPQFVPPGTPAAPVRMLACGLVFMLVTLLVFAGYAVLAGALRRRVLARPRLRALLRHAVAGSFLALGLGLAFTA
ncbi:MULTISPECIES: LysE family translocator [Micromonospora]|uniref:LysE family translocator n=1 Tax=Micromonospora chalcea TaxID=1874 RepID=A0ABX9XU55_MICCH|nr:MULTISPECIES: LysE family translocator [Micromonospora]MBC8994618.1 LysE family translocator [Micromonospora chalcea]MBQ1059618.1 LysE family translocator [Micromonospora sp. C41]ODB73639.1 lysine transporter LysE [Micromonospora sp. II]RQW84970.1 LysE family translocator [Micromonospora chalcea]